MPGIMLTSKPQMVSCEAESSSGIDISYQIAVVDNVESG